MIIFNKKTNRLENESGFTLMEVLVSLVILTVGMLGIISSVNLVMHYQDESKNRTMATLYASNKLEEIKRVSVNEPSGGAYGFNYLGDDAGYLNGYSQPDDWTRTSSDTVNGMARSWTIQVYPVVNDVNESFLDPTTVRMLEAVVKTQWTDRKGNTKDVELAMVLTRRRFAQ